MSFTVRGPKGGVVVRRAALKRITQTLPALVKRFGKVNISAAPEPVPSPVAKLRARIVAFCHWGIANESDIHYSQQRPMERLKTPTQLTQLPRFADCSEFATDSYAYAGGPDPNGENFNGTGNTTSMLQHGRVVGVADAKPGDLCVWADHVCIVLEPGADPLLCSHGQEKGPLAIRYSAERLYHAGTASFRNYLD